jgi:hypothetical protein
MGDLHMKADLEAKERIVWIDHFPIRVGIATNGPWVAAAVGENTPYGTPADALCEAINTAIDENRSDHLQEIRAGKGFIKEVASVTPLSRWGKEYGETFRQSCNGYYDQLSVEDLWLCQGFDDDDFVVLPYKTLLKILDVAEYFKQHGKIARKYVSGTQQRPQEPPKFNPNTRFQKF